LSIGIFNVLVLSSIKILHFSS